MSSTRQKIMQFTLGLVFWTSLCWGEMASIAKDRINIRSGPGTNYELLWQLYKDYPVKILEKKGDWAKTMDYENDIGWIHRSLLSKTHTVIVTVDKANIRTGPGAQYGIAFKAEQGVIFYLVGRKGKWLKIRYLNAYEGWIRQDLVWGE
jgi:SH3-like domain-containing protein